MISRTHALATTLALTLCITAGCSATRTASNADTSANDDARVSGGIAAIAGESAGTEDTISSDDLQIQPGSFAEQLLRGRVAGVEVIDRPGGGFLAALLSW